MFTESILKNSSMQLTTSGATVISVGDDSNGKYVEVISSPLMQRARIVKSDILVKKGVVHYVDYPLTTDPGKGRSNCYINRLCTYESLKYGKAKPKLKECVLYHILKFFNFLLNIEDYSLLLARGYSVDFTQYPWS